MTINGFIKLAIYFLVLLAITKPLGLYMAKVFSGQRTFMGRLVGPVERLIYRICRIDPEEEHHWTTYAAAMLMFSVVSLLVLYALQRL
ncbi:MAG TPA: potassium-transporting ATPase subunit KdpA, partial [Blastocatellia bacterium]|nr:potassium-transporting ATPase subunit KdpA [Blastocatellia bacterium]